MMSEAEMPAKRIYGLTMMTRTSKIAVYELVRRSTILRTVLYVKSIVARKPS